MPKWIRLTWTSSTAQNTWQPLCTYSPRWLTSMLCKPFTEASLRSDIRWDCWCHQVSGTPNAGVASALIFSILPAHLMRSVAGGYDNESVAVTAIVMTFFLWTRSLRTPKSWIIFGPLAALSYIYMVAGVWENEVMKNFAFYKPNEHCLCYVF